MSQCASRWIVGACSLGVVLQLCACGAEDPTGAGSDDGEEDVATAEAALSPPIMRMPFHCGQTWSAQTRSDHSPWQAVDFNRTDDFGDAVLASAGGTVTRVDNEGNTSYGRWIEIGHGDGWRTRYAHLSVQLVTVGQTVKMGQKIGEVGSSGGSTGPHLHYEQLHDGSPVKVVLGGNAVNYFETRSYTSHNGC
jgi:hypothetical protein